MEDLREVEVQHIKEVCTLLSNQYPNLLKVEEYEHPVKGTRTSLYIIPNNKSVDIEMLRGIEVRFMDREVHILTSHQRLTLTDIFKDATVINV